MDGENDHVMKKSKCYQRKRQHTNYTVRLMVIGLTSLDRACLFDLPLSFSL